MATLGELHVTLTVREVETMPIWVWLVVMYAGIAFIIMLAAMVKRYIF